MENYEKKYNEAIERMKSWAKGEHPECFSEAQKTAEFIFPELKESESEDERIRTAIIRILKGETGYISKEDTDRYITWLENQGEFDDNIITRDDEILQAISVGLTDVVEDAGWSDFGGIPIEEIQDWLEKQGENKPTDKVEPKFKPGDWIIFNGVILHIDEVVNGYYRTTSRGDGIHNSYDWNIDNAARLWTIQEAKDGDVLTTDNFIFIFKSIDNSNGVHYYCHYEISKREDDGPRFGIALPQSLMGIVGGTFTHYKPATKEQRDLLFQKMKEAGYEWDAEKKELKKMEVVSKESEDEKIREQLCDFLRDNMLYQDAQYFISWLDKRKSDDEVMKIRRKAYSDGYIHGQDNIAISLGKESIEALEHFVRCIRESGYASPYDNRTKLVYRLLEQLKQIVK